MTPSHVTRRARSSPASPRRAAFDAIRRERDSSADAIASGDGSTTHPVDAVGHELERSTGIGRRNHRFAGEKRFQRHVPVVLVERRVHDSERVFVQIDEALLAHRAGEVMRSATPSEARPAPRSAARCVPSPTTTRRVRDDRRARIARTARSGRLIDSIRPTNRM